MCGIWFCLGNFCSANVKKHVDKVKARGPEDTRIVSVAHAGTMGFNRLAINGLNPDGMQPFLYDPTGFSSHYELNTIQYMCNGEIYNWKELAKEYDIKVKSDSDCEVLGELYYKNCENVNNFFRLLDGVFAIVIVDLQKNQVVIGRDPYGVRPLYVGDNKYFSSEMKGLTGLCKNIVPFMPGTYRIYNASSLELIENKSYIQVPFLKNPQYNEWSKAVKAVRMALEDAVQKRMLTERPVACLLSGGLDSSLISSLVAKNLRDLELPPLKTFSIGMAGSTDIAYARKVAEFIQSDHTEIVLTPDDFFNAIPQVIHDIESFDTTSVRASVGNWLVSKYIREHSDCKVVFNGDGSDEVFGSYMYFYNAPNNFEFEQETQRLLSDIHYFDVLRSDRSISSHGLEPRTPFLDRQFVQVALSLPTNFRRPRKGGVPEKNILREAFNDGTVLPDEVLWRKKEAFSDGVSSLEKSWYEIIQEKVLTLVPSNWEEFAKQYTYLPPKTPEQYYYRTIFEKHYGGHEKVLPYFWMPKWCEGATDPSARTLNIYKKID
jgi:asparagine synthase (glutamine-hydrolysing)